MQNYINIIQDALTANQFIRDIQTPPSYNFPQLRIEPPEPLNIFGAVHANNQATRIPFQVSGSFRTRDYTRFASRKFVNRSSGNSEYRPMVEFCNTIRDDFRRLNTQNLWQELYLTTRTVNQIGYDVVTGSFILHNDYGLFAFGSERNQNGTFKLYKIVDCTNLEFITQSKYYYDFSLNSNDRYQLGHDEAYRFYLLPRYVQTIETIGTSTAFMAEYPFDYLPTKFNTRININITDGTEITIPSGRYCLYRTGPFAYRIRLAGTSMDSPDLVQKCHIDFVPNYSSTFCISRMGQFETLWINIPSNKDYTNGVYERPVQPGLIATPRMTTNKLTSIRRAFQESRLFDYTNLSVDDITMDTQIIDIRRNKTNQMYSQDTFLSLYGRPNHLRETIVQYYQPNIEPVVLSSYSHPSDVMASEPASTLHSAILTHNPTQSSPANFISIAVRLDDYLTPQNTVENENEEDYSDEQELHLDPDQDYEPDEEEDYEDEIDEEDEDSPPVAPVISSPAQMTEQQRLEITQLIEAANHIKLTLGREVVVDVMNKTIRCV